MILLTKDHLTRDTKDKITSRYNKAVIKAIYTNMYLYIFNNAFKYIPFIGTISEYVL